MKKIIILLSLCLFLTGCTIDYNIVMKNDKSIVENSNIRIYNSELKNYNYTLEEIRKGKEESYKDFLKKLHYKYDFKIVDNNVDIILNRTSDSIKEIEKNPYFQGVYNTIKVDETNDTYTVIVDSIYNGYKTFNPDETIGIDIRPTQFNLNIKFMNDVISSNADKKDEKTNTHTWIFDKNTKDKSIIFTVKNNKNEKVKTEKKNNKIDFKILIIIIFAMLIIFISFLVLVIIKNNKNNKI